METSTMKPRALAFLLSEANGQRSRDTAIIPSGTGKVTAGTVLGALTANAKHFVPSPDAETVGKEGAEVASAILAYGVDATDVDVEVAIIARDAEAKLPMLSFDASVNDQTKTDAKIAQLKAATIVVR